MKDRMKANASKGFFKALAVITLLLGAMCGDKSIGVFDAEKYQYSPES